MAAINLSTAENVAAVVVIALVLLAALFAKVLIGNLAKIAASVILVAAAILVWTQRSSLQECADRFKESATSPTGGTTTCDVLGVDLTVDVPR